MYNREQKTMKANAETFNSSKKPSQSLKKANEPRAKHIDIGGIGIVG